MDGWMDGWLAGWLAGWLDGYTCIKQWMCGGCVDGWRRACVCVCEAPDIAAARARTYIYIWVGQNAQSSHPCEQAGGAGFRSKAALEHSVCCLVVCVYVRMLFPCAWYIVDYFVVVCL